MAAPVPVIVESLAPPSDSVPAAPVPAVRPQPQDVFTPEKFWRDWDDLDADQELSCPRVRKAPPKTYKSYDAHWTEWDALGQSPDGALIQQPAPLPAVALEVKDPKDAKLDEVHVLGPDELEKHEDLIEFNISYQDLGDPYQNPTFKKLLKKVHRVKRLYLGDNLLTDLSGVDLPVCEHLFVARNDIKGFLSLPRAPNLTSLDISDNLLENVRFLNRYPNLKSINVRGNPLAFQPQYRERIVLAHPGIQFIDSVPVLRDGVHKNRCGCA
eukprot:TRINITY_DN13705_c0_g1_i1.p1 TRINITY_DN13705_c0_g1~~TRINITY_DN13705_c0_g1_i1.p1  ORF type:complete len:293 (+),score=36.14 TRINITY_DN13705_c0_g1_i1:74-880(+)